MTKSTGSLLACGNCKSFNDKVQKGCFVPKTITFINGEMFEIYDWVGCQQTNLIELENINEYFYNNRRKT